MYGLKINCQGLNSGFCLKNWHPCETLVYSLDSHAEEPGF